MAKNNNNKRGKTRKISELRRQAERRLRFDSTPLHHMSEADVAALVHELRVHEIELQMQNESLREAQVEVEESRAKYADLFDFAPVGYLVVDSEGIIRESNLTAASMLRMERGRLVNSQFSDFLSRASLKPWLLHFGTVFKAGKPQETELELRRQEDQPPMFVRVRSRPVENGAGKVVQCHTAIIDITERVHAEEMYTTVIRNLQDGFCVIDAEGRYLQANETCCRMAGRSRGELLGMTVSDIWEPEHQDEIRQHLQKARRQGWDKFLTRHCRTDGRQMYCDITIQRLDGNQFFVFARDVTERQRAQQQRQEALQRLQRVAKATNDGIWDLDLETDTFWHNEAYTTAFGYPADEPGISSRWWEERVHPEDQDRILAAVNEALHSREDRFTDHYRFQRKDGTYAWVLASVYVLRNDEGTAVRVVGSVRDITEKLDLLDQLESERRKLATILDTALTGIVVADERGGLSYANPAAQRLHAQAMPPGEGPESHRSMGLCHPDGTPCEPRDLPVVRAALDGETQHMTELLVKRPDGEVRHIMANATPLTNRSGKTTGAVAVIQDITELKTAEQALREARDKLEERVRERTAELDETVATLHQEVAERIEAQDRLIQQNEMLQRIINNVPVMLCFFNVEGNVALINDEFTHVLGYSSEDFQRQGLVELAGPDSGDRRRFWDHMMIPEPEWQDFSVRTKDGSPVPSSWATVRLRDGSYVGIGIDIRERKRWEDSLRENARQLEQQAELLNLAHDSIVVSDMEGSITFWNHGAEQTYGWSRDEALGQISHDLLNTRLPLKLIEITARLLSRGRWTGELTHTARSGETIIVSSRWALQRDENSRPTGILVIDRDVTRQKRAEQARIKAMRLAESITNTIQESLLVLDRGLRVISANQTFHRVFQVTPEETNGRFIYEIGHGQWDIPELRRLLEDILPKDSSFEDFEVEHSFPKIGSRTMLLNARRIYRQTQETETILLAIQDITFRKEQENRIRESKKQLAALTEQLLLAEERERHRIALLLHDSIGQYLSFSKRELGVLQKRVPDQVQEGINYVREQIEEAIRQTRDLTFELSPTTLHTFGLEAAVEELADQYAERGGFQYDFKATDDEKPLSEQMKVLLFRAAREMLMNITKHAEASDVHITIERRNGTIHMVFEDNGKGFDVSRLDEVVRSHEGFGLFSIRERLAHVGGAFAVESQAGQGTKVTLIAPLEPTNEDNSRSGTP